MVPSRVGIGAPCGSVSGSPIAAAMRSISSSRRGVLEPLGLVVHAVPRIAERLREVRLDDAVAAERAQRGAAPGARSAARRDSARARPAPGRRAAAPSRSPTPARWPSAAAMSFVAAASPVALELVDRLEVVLDRRGQRLGDAARASAASSSRTVTWPRLRPAPRTSSTGTIDWWRTSLATLP